ncbi:MAG: TRAP transporter small permease subunit [Planctomycetota bacterium]|jgi:TRAP-type C4-dicarboxylate transport system permease small subunit|nr:TRAP transporter small permease subunit [Planctomycetota bacterium]
MKTIAIIESAERFVTGLFVLVGSACLAGIVLTIGYSVILRYIFNQPLLWYLELCSVFVVWLAFFPLGANYLLNRHFTIDTFVRVMPESWRPAQMAIVDLLSLACAVLLAVSSYDAIDINGNMELNTIPLPLAISSYLPVLVGGVSYFALILLKYAKLSLGAGWGKAGE